mgnify:CR=1 FL=1|jgi:hypothetical protein
MKQLAKKGTYNMKQEEIDNLINLSEEYKNMLYKFIEGVDNDFENLNLAITILQKTLDLLDNLKGGTPNDNSKF